MVNEQEKKIETHFLIKEQLTLNNYINEEEQ